MVHFAVVKSAGSSTRWTDFIHLLILQIFTSKNFYKLWVVFSEIPFGEDSCHIETSQIDLQFGLIDSFLFDTTFNCKSFGADFNMLCFKYCK